MDLEKGIDAVQETGMGEDAGLSQMGLVGDEFDIFIDFLL